MSVRPFCKFLSAVCHTARALFVLHTVNFLRPVELRLRNRGISIMNSLVLYGTTKIWLHLGLLLLFFALGTSHVVLIVGQSQDHVIKDVKGPLVFTLVDAGRRAMQRAATE